MSLLVLCQYIMFPSFFPTNQPRRLMLQWCVHINAIVLQQLHVRRHGPKNLAASRFQIYIKGNVWEIYIYIYIYSGNIWEDFRMLNIEQNRNHTKKNKNIDLWENARICKPLEPDVLQRKNCRNTSQTKCDLMSSYSLPPRS